MKYLQLYIVILLSILSVPGRATEIVEDKEYQADSFYRGTTFGLTSDNNILVAGYLANSDTKEFGLWIALLDSSFEEEWSNLYFEGEKIIPKKITPLAGGGFSIETDSTIVQFSGSGDIVEITPKVMDSSSSKSVVHQRVVTRYPKNIGAGEYWYVEEALADTTKMVCQILDLDETGDTLMILADTIHNDPMVQVRSIHQVSEKKECYIITYNGVTPLPNGEYTKQIMRNSYGDTLWVKKVIGHDSYGGRISHCLAYPDGRFLMLSNKTYMEKSVPGQLFGPVRPQGVFLTLLSYQESPTSLNKIAAPQKRHRVTINDLNSKIMLSLTASYKDNVQLSIFDSRGRIIIPSLTYSIAEGRNDFLYLKSALGTGVYYYHLQGSVVSETGRFIIR